MNVNPLLAATTTGLSGVQQSGQIYQPAVGGAHFTFKLPEAPKHIVPLEQIGGAQQTDPIVEPTNWGQMLQKMALEVNDSQNASSAKIRDVLAGGKTPIHEAMIAMQESQVRFEMLSEIRNKMVSAYQEIMRMQV